MTDPQVRRTEQSSAGTGEFEGTRRELTRLKWFTTIVPAVVIFLYETVRHDFLDHLLPVATGNLLVGLLALVLAFAFSEFVFRIIERLQAQAVARSREVATLTAVVQERERLSRELHDGLAQLVSYLLVRLDTVQALVEGSRREEAIAELEQLRAVADHLYADVRESITGLRSRVAERGLLPALQDYTDEFEERYALGVTLEAGVLPDRLPPLVGLQLFRIVQEALTNVRKHARARHVRVALTMPRADLLQVVIADDGQGFDPASARGERSYGLVSMRERAESLGGSFQIESRPGCGTRVTVTVPIDRLACGAMDGTLAGITR